MFSRAQKSAGLLSLLVASCGPQIDKKNNPSHDSSFIADPVSVLSLESGQMLSGWSLPTEKNVLLKSCLKDVAYLNPILDQDFAIEGGAKPQVKKTDKQGCLVWMEKIPFNYVAPETFVTLKRTISSRSAQRGSVDLVFAINPWRKGEEALVDMNAASAKPPKTLSEKEAFQSFSIQSGEKAASEEKTSGLRIDHVVYAFGTEHFTPSGTEISLRLNFKASFERKLVDGTMVPEEVNAGNFRLSFALVERIPAVGKEDHRILAEKSMEVKTRDGNLVVETPMQLVALPGKQSLFEIRMHLEALDGPRGLAAADGIIALDALKGSDWSVSSKPDIDYDHFVQVTKENSAKLVTTSAPIVKENIAQLLDTGRDPIGAPGFVFDQIEAGSAGFTKTDNSLKYPSEAATNIKACLQNPIDLEPIVDFPFEISTSLSADVEGEVHVQRTDSVGCLYWIEKTPFNAFEEEHWIPHWITIRSRQAPYLNITRKFKIQINPWEIGWLHAWDSRNGAQPSNPNPGDGHIEVINFAFAYQGRDLSVDNYVSLSQDRKYRLSFHPVIVKPHRFSEGPSPEDIREGKLRMRVLLLTEGPNGAAGDKPSETRYISHFEDTVEIINTAVVANIKLPFRFLETPLIASRNMIVIELSSLDKGPTFKKTTVAGPFPTMEGSGSVDLKPTTLSVDDWIELGKKKRASEVPALSSRELYQKYLNVPDLSAAEKTSVALQDAEIEKLIADPAKEKDLAKKFCSLFFPGGATRSFWSAVTRSDKPDFQKCTEDPKSMLRLKKSTHVLKLNEPATKVGANRFDMNVGASFERCFAKSQTDHRGKTHDKEGWMGLEGDVGGGTGEALPVQANVVLNGGYKIGTSWYRTKDRSKELSKSQCERFDMDAEIPVEFVKMALNAMVEKCVTVSTKDFSASRMLCLPGGPVQESFVESWYFISQLSVVNNMALLDAGDIADRQWSKVIRGKAEFEKFRQVLAEPTNHFLFEKDLDTRKHEGIDGWVAKSFEGLPLFTDGNFPGRVTE